MLKTETDYNVSALYFIDGYLALLKATRLIYDFVWELGYDMDLETQRPQGFSFFEKLESISEELSVTYQDILDFYQRPPKSFKDYKKIIGFATTLFGTYQRIKEIADQEGADSSNFDTAVFKTLFLKVLPLKLVEFELPAIYRALVFFTIIKPAKEVGLSEPVRDENGRIVRYPHRKTEVNLDRIGELFSDPVGLLSKEYLAKSGESRNLAKKDEIDPAKELQERSDRLFKRLRDLLLSLGAQTVYGVKPGEWSYFDSPEEMAVAQRSLSFWYEFLDRATLFGATLTLIANGDGSYGIAVLPRGGVNQSFQINGWNITLASGLFTQPFLLNGEQNPELSDGKVQLEIKLRKSNQKTKAFVIGGKEGTRLELGQVKVSGGIELSKDARELGVLLEFDSVQFVLDPGDGDGFLRKILPEKGTGIKTDLAIGLSNTHGFYIRGSSGLDVEFPQHKSIGNVLTITAFKLGLHGSKDDVRLFAALSGSVKLGPFTLTLDTVGLQNVLAFPDDEEGNLGMVDFDLAFKAPNGVGIEIDGKVIKGGGYLYFDGENSQYAGVVALNIKNKIDLKAFGLITTKGPDGQEGYSLLLFVSTEFPPMQLGLGFTLNGVGGVIGAHRTIHFENLRQGLQGNTLDDLLFPADPIRNATRIISNMNRSFPVRQRQFLFGLIGLIGWGPDKVVSLKLGLIIEFPDPTRLGLLGVLKAGITKEVAGKEIAVLKLQINFIGEINFDTKFIGFDASLYDSKLLSFRLEGQMALRMSYGGDSYFALSVGGFHPDFADVPKGFPVLDRLKIPLVDKSNAQILLTCYLAITSNSIQIGAGVDVYFKISKFNLKGDFFFDALLYFDPPEFIVLVKAGISVRWGSTTLAGIEFTGSLRGPGPWNLKGKAKISLWLWSKTFHIDKTYGDEVGSQSSSIRLLPKLRKELQDARNWEALTPRSSQLLVDIRKGAITSATGSEELMIHPTGGIAISQSLLPLGIQLDKFGSFGIQDQKHYQLELTDGQSQMIPSRITKTSFAPANYLQLSDEEKLSRKSFESFSAGLAMVAVETVGFGNSTGKELVYEKKIYDGDGSLLEEGQEVEDKGRFAIWSKNNMVAQSESGTQVLYAGSVNPVLIKPEKYKIAYKWNLSEYEEVTEASTETEAHQMMNTIVNTRPELAPKITIVPTYQME